MAKNNNNPEWFEVILEKLNKDPKEKSPSKEVQNETDINNK